MKRGVCIRVLAALGLFMLRQASVEASPSVNVVIKEND